MLFKCDAYLTSAKFPIINLKIVGKDASDNIPSDREFDLNTSQNIMLKMKSTNIEFEPPQVTIRSVELSQQHPKICRQFTAFPKLVNWQEQRITFYFYNGDTNEHLGSGDVITWITPTPVQDIRRSNARYLNGETIDIIPASEDDYERHLENDDIYKILHHPKGRVLIVSIIKFPKWGDRGDRGERGRNECELMKKLFAKLGCDVQVEPDDLDAKEICSSIKEFLNRDNHTGFSIVFVMSHGKHIQEEGTVFFGSDCKWVRVSEIRKYFKNDQIIANLIQKPRIGLFQCCRKTIAMDEQAIYKDQHFDIDNILKYFKDTTDELADILLGFSTYEVTHLIGASLQMQWLMSFQTTQEINILKIC